MSKDPVCGMNVADNSPYKSRCSGHDYVFCCDACRAEFDQAPDVYPSAVGAESNMSFGDDR
jgi:P-type Cu+ transporter